MAAEKLEDVKDLSPEQQKEIEDVKRKAYEGINKTQPTVDECIAKLNELRKKQQL